MSRLSYEESCRRLQGKYLDPGDAPPMADHCPQADDDGDFGVRFFRTSVGGGDDFDNLTLPRTFFGRSEINDASFRGTDLTESNLCWNDLTDVDFTNAMLVGCDLRASDFTRVKFVSADLTRSDMRMSSFGSCDFSDAKMESAILTRKQGAKMNLSEKQRSEISWTDNDGPEPRGG